MEKQDFFSGSKFVTELSPKDFDSIEVWKLKEKKCAIILFYVPWCPFCKGIEKTWKELGEKAAFFEVYAMNCEKYKSHCNKIREDNQELITSYPSIIIYSKGSPVEKVGNSENERTTGHFIRACMRNCEHLYEGLPVPKKNKDKF